MTMPGREREPTSGRTGVGDPLLAKRVWPEREDAADPTPPPLPRTGRTRPGPRAGAKRRHPARGSRAVALLVSIGSTAGLAVSFSHEDSSAGSGGDSQTGEPTTTASPAPVATVVTTPVAPTPIATTPVATAPAAAARAHALANGTFIGQTFTNRWGPVQVQVTIRNGQITDVAALQTPAGHNRSIQISRISTPLLRREALAAQSADVHTVSGATYTSTGYRQSLQSALDAARAGTG